MLIAAIIMCGGHLGNAGVKAAVVDGTGNQLEFTELESLKKAAASCNNGTITLAWHYVTEEQPATVVLEQSATPGFEDPVIRYRGTDSGSVISGLPEGTHYFRVRDAASADAASSSVLKVQVVFFPRERLYWLLAAGGAVVLATFAVVVFGYRKTRRAGDGVTSGKENRDDG